MKIVLSDEDYYLFRKKGRVLCGLGYLDTQAPVGCFYKLFEYVDLEKPFFAKKIDKGHYHVYNE